jgi:hypothetical protein
MNATSTQPASMSPAKRVLDRIVEDRFTGLLRVSAHEARGEFWFLAGILEEALFGVSRGEEAIERLLRATQLTFQAELRLPYVNGGFKKPMPASGSFAEFRPVVLMRHCESYALTCSLVLRSKDRTVRVTYRTGELLSVDAGAAGNEALPALLDSEEGSYEFLLPTFELPEGVNAAIPASATKLSLAERIDRALSDESTRPAEAKPLVEPAAKSEEAAAAEAKRKAEETAAAEAKRKAEEAAAAEARRKAEEAAAAEAKRKAEETAAAEAKRKAEETAAAEARRKAEEAAATEARRKAEAAAAAEAKRKAEEAAAAEAKRKAEAAAAAEAKRKAEAAAAAEAKRKAEEAAAAEAKRKAEEAAAAEAKRKAEELEAAAAKARRLAEPTEASRPNGKAVPSNAEPSPAESDRQGSEQPAAVKQKAGLPWFWLFLVLLLGSLAYFMKEGLGVR